MKVDHGRSLPKIRNTRTVLRLMFGHPNLWPYNHQSVLHAMSQRPFVDPHSLFRQGYRLAVDNRALIGFKSVP